MKNVIKITKKYLGFREDAGELARRTKEQIHEKNFGQLYWDFKDVLFTSRSFVDELLNVLEQFESKGVRVKILHLAPKLKKFIASVKQKKKAISLESSVRNCL